MERIHIFISVSVEFHMLRATDAYKIILRPGAIQMLRLKES